MSSDRLDAFRQFIITLSRLRFFVEEPVACWVEKESHIGVRYTECTMWFKDVEGGMMREVHCI